MGTGGDAGLLQDRGEKQQSASMRMSAMMRPIMSKQFCDYVAAEIVREKTVSAAIFNSILIGGNAKLRVWIDEEGSNRFSTSDGPPPAWW